MPEIKFRWICLLVFTFFFIERVDVNGQPTNLIADYSSEEISPDFNKLFIVFAGPYPASPSSAFGHLFLLIEPNRQDIVNLQLWKAINYAADVQDHSGASTLFNGLVGNLEGSFEILPFYKKIQDYSYAEARDLWLFAVDLNEGEKKRFADYINSNKPLLTQYRFSDKNCATRVNEALHHTLGKELTKQFFVLPQQILNDSDIAPRLSKPIWIENFESQLHTLYLELGKKNINKNNLDTLNNTDRVKFLKTYEWLYNNTSTSFDESKREFIQELRYQVSMSKSDYDFQDFETKEFSIHYPGQVGLTYNYNDVSKSSINLNFRLGLHSFEDISSTYPKFDYLEVASLNMKVEKSSVSIDEFWLFHQSSRQPVNSFRSPVSWTLGLGGKRFNLNTENDLSIGLYTAVGKSHYVINNWINSLVLNLNPVYIEEHGLSMIINPEIEQRVFLHENFKAMFSVSNPIFFDSRSKFNLHSELLLVYNLGQNVGLNAYIELNEYAFETRAGIKFNFPY